MSFIKDCGGYPDRCGHIWTTTNKKTKLQSKYMMKTRYIHFRVTNDEHGTIRDNAKQAGKTVAEYLRDISLNRGVEVMGKLNKIERISINARTTSDFNADKMNKCLDRIEINLRDVLKVVKDLEKND